MDLKRNNKDVKKVAATEAFDIKQKAGSVFIEGFANKATVDRGNDIIDPKAWELDNFKKNPIILFNHGFDTLGGTPVGRATQIKPTEDGLFLKVRLSNSEAPGIKMVRDLVEERILRAFSVGFEPKQTEKAEVGEGDSAKQINRITKAELFEVSIVGVPMNQDSLFEVTEKALKTKSLYEIKKDVLEQKGASYAQDLHEKIHSLEEAGRERILVMEDLAEAATLELEDVKDILAGNTEPTEDFKVAADAIFKEGNTDDEDEDDEEKDSKESGDSADDKDKDSEDKAADGESEDDEDEGSSESEDDEDEGSDESEEKDSKQDFQDCVAGKIPTLLNDGMEQDQAVAVAISKCQEEGKCMIAEDSKHAVFAACFDAVEKFSETGEWDFQSFDSADIVISSTGTDMADTKQAEQEGDNGVTTPIKTSPSEDEFGSPFLDQQKQTNVLLGVLVAEIGKLSAAVAQLNASGAVDEDDKAASEDMEDEEETMAEEDVDKKTLDKAQKSLESLSKRLKNLGY